MINFDNTSIEETKTVKGCVDAFYLLALFVGIPSTGFFWFVWEPLGKGLLFVVLFTFAWTIPIGMSCKNEIKKQESIASETSESNN